MSNLGEILTLVKDSATIVTAVVGTTTLVLVFMRLRVEHPGYKLAAEREMKVYEVLDEIDKTISPALTRSVEEALIERSKLAELRTQIKHLAAGVFTPNELRTPLYALNSFLRGAASDGAADDFVKLPTRLLLSRWNDCKNVARWRISLLRPQDRPYRLFTINNDGAYDFVESFRSKRERTRYIDANPLDDPAKKYAFWHAGEAPGLFHRLR